MLEEISLLTECLPQRCVPGPYLESKFPWIAEQVNKRLGQAAIDKTLYRVRRSWHESASQLGAYSSLENAKRACPKGYYVFDGSGHIVYPVTSTYKVKVMVGGAPVSPAFADKIGADGYSRNAIEAVEVAKKLVGAN